MKQGGTVGQSLREAAPWAVVAAVVALVLFVWTAAPTITWRNDGADGPELATAVDVLGVPHPPGYPTYVLLGKLFSLLVPIGDIAHRLALFSAVCGAATVGFSVMIAGTIPTRRGSYSGRVLLISGLALAVSPLLWSQSTIAEVYSPASTVLSACLLLIVIRCADGNGTRWLLPAAGFFLGLGAGLHLTVLFLGIAAGPALIVAGVRIREVAVGAGATAAGMSVFLLLPLLAAREPPIAWGAPVDLSGFLWTVTGAPYRDLLFAVPFGELPARAAGVLGLLTREIGAVGWLLAIWGGWRVWLSGPRWLIVLLGGLASLGLLYTLGYNSRDFVVYLIPVVVVASVFLAVGANWGMEVLRPLPSGSWVSNLALAGVFTMVPVLTFGLNVQELDLSEDGEAARYSSEAIAIASDQNAIVIADTDEEVFSLWYQRYVGDTDGEPFVIARVLLQYEWYRGQVRDQLASIVPAEPTNYEDTIERIIGLASERPIFMTTDNEGAGPGFTLEPAGPLFRVISARDQ